MYIIFEGNDGVGKSTTMKAVAERVKIERPDSDIILTHHPGSTPLGAHIRQLVKFPNKIDPNINLDEYSRQLLYMVDTINFIKTLLIPSLEQGKIVFADRSSFISSIVYGLADGLSLAQISRLLDLITPPRADKLFILQCPWQIAKSRITKTRTELDHYDQKQAEFFERVERTYDTLLGPGHQTMMVSKVVALSDVIYVDTTLGQYVVIDIITKYVLELLDAKKSSNSRE